MSLDMTKLEQTKLLAFAAESLAHGQVMAPTVLSPEDSEMMSGVVGSAKDYLIDLPTNVFDVELIDGSGDYAAETNDAFDTHTMTIEAGVDTWGNNIVTSRHELLGTHGDITDAALQKVARRMGLAMQMKIERDMFIAAAKAAETAGNISELAGAFSRSDLSDVMDQFDGTLAPTEDRFFLGQRRSDITQNESYSLADRSGDSDATLMRQGQIGPNFLGFLEGFEALFNPIRIKPSHLGYVDEADLLANGSNLEIALYQRRAAVAYTKRSIAHVPVTGLEISRVEADRLTKVEFESAAMFKSEVIFPQETFVIVQEPLA